MTASKGTRRPEGRGRPGGSPDEGAKVRTQSRVALPANLERVNAVAKQSAKTRFTALMHHVDGAALARAFRRLKRRATAGVDGMTVEQYEQDLDRNLKDLLERLHTGRYRAQPVRGFCSPSIRSILQR